MSARKALSSTPEGTFRRMIDPMPAKDMNAAADLWAPDGTVEWTAAGRTVATSRPHRLDHFVVLTVRDGLIALFRDYWSPLSAAAAAGGLTGLIDSLEIDSVDGKGA